MSKSYDGESFAVRNLTLDVWRSQQDFDAFMEETDDVWPEGESVDEFIEMVRRWRREGEERNLP